MENGRRHQTGLRRFPHLLLFRWVWRRWVYCQLCSLLPLQRAVHGVLVYVGKGGEMPPPCWCPEDGACNSQISEDGKNASLIQVQEGGRPHFNMKTAKFER